MNRKAALIPWIMVIPFLAGGSPVRTSTTPVDLNLATQVELQSLPGIGPARAKAIVARRTRRRFRRVRELLTIKGIGRKTFQRLRPRVIVRRLPPRPVLRSARNAGMAQKKSAP